MKHCTQCGHLLGLGRFCTNCGAPVAARDPLSDPIETVRSVEPSGSPAVEDCQDTTAERPAAPPPASTPPVAQPSTPPSPPPSPPLRVPPVVVEPPPPPRFPLFADQVSEVAAATPAAPKLLFVTTLAGSGRVRGCRGPMARGRHRQRLGGRLGGRAPLAGGPGALAVARAARRARGSARGCSASSSGATTPRPRTRRVCHHRSGSAAPRRRPHGRRLRLKPRGRPTQVDVDGNPTSYAAANMLDGVPETAWRAEVAPPGSSSSSPSPRRPGSPRSG